MERIVLAYSGGLDSTAAIRWLAEHFSADIIAVTLDLGQGHELEDVRDRALAAGAARAHVLDVRDEFARGFVLPALKAGATCENRDPMATALGRPLIAQKLVEIAGIEQATAIAHGSGVEGRDQARIGGPARALNPTLTVIVPPRGGNTTPTQGLRQARAGGAPVPAAAESPCRRDANLWGRSIEWGVLDGPGTGPGMFALTKAPADCPAEPAYVELSFDRGVPTAINGVAMPLVDLIASLGMIAGAHGVGRIDTVDPRLVAVKARRISEAPAAVVLHAAHQELQKLVTPTDMEPLCREMSLKYADIVSSGLWFTPSREAIDAFVGKVQERVTGAIRIKLFKGDSQTVDRTSPFALHETAMVSGS